MASLRSDLVWRYITHSDDRNHFWVVAEFDQRTGAG